VYEINSKVLFLSTFYFLGGGSLLRFWKTIPLGRCVLSGGLSYIRAALHSGKYGVFISETHTHTHTHTHIYLTFTISAYKVCWLTTTSRTLGTSTCRLVSAGVHCSSTYSKPLLLLHSSVLLQQDDGSQVVLVSLLKILLQVYVEISQDVTVKATWECSVVHQSVILQCPFMSRTCK
jgi:hypothetical protein